MCLLFPLFYKTIKTQIQEHGIKYYYKHKTGFLDLPMPGVLWQQATSTGIPGDTMVRIIFPLLAFIFSLMVGFCGIHYYYVVTAQTTLQHKIMLYILKDKLQEQKDSGTKSKKEALALLQRPTNPFSQGWKGNLYQVLGRNLFLVLLPIPVSPPPPFIPTTTTKKDE